MAAFAVLFVMFLSRWSSPEPFFPAFARRHRGCDSASMAQVMSNPRDIGITVHNRYVEGSLLGRNGNASLRSMWQREAAGPPRHGEVRVILAHMSDHTKDAPPPPPFLPHPVPFCLPTCIRTTTKQKIHATTTKAARRMRTVSPRQRPRWSTKPSQPCSPRCETRTASGPRTTCACALEHTFLTTAPAARQWRGDIRAKHPWGVARVVGTSITVV